MLMEMVGMGDSKADSPFAVKPVNYEDDIHDLANSVANMGEHVQALGKVDLGPDMPRDIRNESRYRTGKALAVYAEGIVQQCHKIQALAGCGFYE